MAVGCLDESWKYRAENRYEAVILASVQPGICAWPAIPESHVAVRFPGAGAGAAGVPAVVA